MIKSQIINNKIQIISNTQHSNLKHLGIDHCYYDFGFLEIVIYLRFEIW
jgi:hypothetical protein